jgi:hypothetical protein
MLAVQLFWSKHKIKLFEFIAQWRSGDYGDHTPTLQEEF